jgi:two-component system nitrate/nitrite response regulator NarL
MNDPPEAWCLVLIASPSAVVRRRWNEALSRKFPTLLAASRTQLVRKLAKFSPSILFLDLNLLGKDVRKSVHLMRRVSSATKIVVLASSPNETAEIMALQAGARGYCSRDLVPTLMERAAQMILKGEIWCARSILPYLLREVRNRGELRQIHYFSHLKELKTLTLRQREVADWIARGSSNKQIANALNITEGAVKAQMTVIFRKLGVSDRLELALLVRDETANILPSSKTSSEKTA